MPAGTPCLPYAHHFGSPVWTIGDDVRFHPVGPAPGYPVEWVDGDLGMPSPPSTPFGLAGDFAAPNAPEIPRGPFPFRIGIPEICWIGEPTFLIDPVEVAAIGSCCLTLAYARVIDLLYDEEFSKINDFITDWMGSSPNVIFYTKTTLIPAFVLIMHPTFSLVILAGTDNDEQLSTQAFQGAIPPRPQGNVNTLPLWANTASHVFQQLRIYGSSGEEPLIIAGHSYGAAVASVMAMRVTRRNLLRPVSLLTFASPKPSNWEGIRMLDTIKHRHIANYSDLVTVVPTNLRTTSMFSLLVVGPTALSWGQWATFETTEVYYADGSHVNVGEQNLAYNVLLPAVRRATQGLDWSPSAFHAIKEYIARLAITCAGPCWPITPSSWDILFGAGNIGAGGLEIGSGEPQFFEDGNDGGVVCGAVRIDPPGGPQSGALVERAGDPWGSSNTFRRGMFFGS